MKKHEHNLHIQLESNGPQESGVRSPDSRQDEQLPDTVLPRRLQSDNQPERAPQDADKWDGSLAPQPETTIPVVPQFVGDVDMNKLRDLLFSVRDNNIYCGLCRCPEFSPNEMRSSHYEDCSIGLMCEKLLRLYPREGYAVKWRK
jgi:hypothetical protein